MDEFFNKHSRMIRYLLYAIACLVSLVILFLFYSNITRLGKDLE